MVYSSVPVTPSKAKKEDTALHLSSPEPEHSHFDAEKQNEGACTDPRPLYPPSLFCDKKGNLKFVNLVVRYPCLIFLVLLAICIGITINLSSAAFKNGNPFTSDESTFDLYDKRSLAYDALRLAKEEVGKIRELSLPPPASEDEDGEGGSRAVRIQENLGDVTYWIYEAKTENGLFTKDALPIMRSAEVMFTRHKKYPQYCLLQYYESGNETTSECMKELSVVNTFYASSWNSSVAKSVVSELTTEKIRLYNSIAACVEFNMLCQFNPSNVTDQDIQWARTIHLQIMSMMAHWDGGGELNQDPHEVSLFLAHIKELNTKAPYINFFVDANFTIDNPVTMYSRSIVYWGAPLQNADDSSWTSQTSSQNLLKK